MKKIKLFLAAYINFPNAQNVNCEHIARYINKEKFEVHVMYTDRKPIDKAKYEAMGIHLHKLIHHRYIWFWSKLWSMWRADCDVYYMPKSEKMDRIFAEKFKGKKRFCSSVEGVITQTTNNTLEIRQYFLQLMDASFAISNCVAESVERMWNTTMPVIPLGVDGMKEQRVISEKIHRVIWVGNVKANKRPNYLLDIAKSFPQLSFVMIGDGDMSDQMQTRITSEHLSNVQMLGRIPNSEVYKHMMDSDILLMTSEFEGLPKVIQEAAVCGLPCIYMAENYKVDFIENGVNGFESYSLEEMKHQLGDLVDNPKKFCSAAKEAQSRIKPYLWSNLIHRYEEYFEELMYKSSLR